MFSFYKDLDPSCDNPVVRHNRNGLCLDGKAGGMPLRRTTGDRSPLINDQHTIFNQAVRRLVIIILCPIRPLLGNALNVQQLAGLAVIIIMGPVGMHIIGLLFQVSAFQQPDVTGLCIAHGFSRCHNCGSLLQPDISFNYEVSAFTGILRIVSCNNSGQPLRLVLPTFSCRCRHFVRTHNIFPLLYCPGISDTCLC